jgi:outer membrane lipoprotein-sorting protein
MKKSSISGLMVALILVGIAMGCGNGASEPTPTPTEEIGALPETYQYSMEWSDSNEVSVSLDVWGKGVKSRVDMNMTEPSEETETKIFIDDGEFQWIYDQNENIATKYQLDSDQSDVEMSLVDTYTWWFVEYYFGNVSEEAILAEMKVDCDINPLCSSVAITGHESIGGQSCTKFTSSAYDGSTIIYWISNSGLLIKVEATNTAGYSVDMEYTNIDLNSSISDDTFDIDKVAPGVEITDMTEL